MLKTKKKRSNSNVTAFKERALEVNQVGKGYLFSILVIFAMLFGTSYSIDVINQSSSKMQSSYELIVKVQEIRSYVENMETSLRGYVLYYDKSFLAEYRYSKQRVEESLVSAQRQNNLDQYDKARLKIIKNNLEGWKSSASPLVISVTDSISSNIIKARKSRQNRAGLIEHIRLATDDIIRKGRTETIARIAENNLRRKFIVALLFFGSFSTIWIITGQMKRIHESTVEVLESNEKLAKEVDLREDLQISLQENLAIYSALLDAALDAIIIMNGKGLVVEASSSCYDVFGFKPAELIGKDMTEMIIPPHLQDAHRKGFARYIQTQQGKILGERIKTEGMDKEKNVFSIELTAVRIDKEGELMFAAFLRRLPEEGDV